MSFMWIIRKFEKAFFYIPFLVLALILKVPFSLKCRKCGRFLLFDWHATRWGFCKACCSEDPKLLEGYYVKPSSFLIYKRVVSLIGKVIGKGVILDAGCGSGFLIHKLGSMETRFIGLDLGRVEIKSAASKCPLADFVIGDATQLPFREKTFDWVICTEVLEHLKNPYSAVKEFRRVLKEGGKL